MLISYLLLFFLIISSITKESLVTIAIGLVGSSLISAMLPMTYTLRISAFSATARSIGIFSLTILLQRIYEIDRFAPEIVYLQNHAGEAIMALLCSAAAWFLMSLFHPGKPAGVTILPGTRVRASTYKTYEKVGPWTKLSQWDAEAIAAHEAGHAVASGLYPHIGKTSHVVLQMGVDQMNLNGYCRTSRRIGHSEAMSFLEVRMIVVLAGIEAEFLCVGERGKSGTSDLEKFKNLAISHLQYDEKVVYFNEPANELELKHNIDSILDLQKKYLNIARNLLAENREILDILRALLVEKGIVQGDEYRELLSRVRPVPGCPVISPALNAALKADIESLDEEYVNTPA